MSERYRHVNGRLGLDSEGTIHVQPNAGKYGTSVFRAVRGEMPEYGDWLTPVYRRA